MNLLSLTASAFPIAFFEWFHTPARDAAGIVGLIIIVFLVVEACIMMPDLIRTIKIHRK